MRILFVVLVVLFGLAPVAAQSNLDTVRLIQLQYLSYAPFYIAEQEGYFAEQGIVIEYITPSESQEVFPALVRGDTDVQVEFINAAMFNAIARGAEIQVVADKGYFAAGECTANAFIAPPSVLESGALEDPEQIGALRWQFEVDTVEQYMLERAFENIGAEFDVNALSNEALPPHLFHAALLQDAVDVGFTGEPWITRAEDEGAGSLWLTDEQLAPDLQASMLLFGPRLLRDDPELGQRFMVAYLQGIRQFLEGKTERNLELVTEFTGLDAEIVEAACWAHMDPTGAIRTEGIMEFQAWLLERDLLDRVVEVDEFWNPTYIEHANEVLGEPES